MNIFITTHGCPFQDEIERMTYLFFEDCTLEVVEASDSHDNSVDTEARDSPSTVTERTVAERDSETLRVELWAVVEDNHVKVSGELCVSSAVGADVPDGQPTTQVQALPEKTASETKVAHHKKMLPHGADPVTIRKRSKQAVLHVLHQLFEQVTGEHQPWGILTGIRPLKLVHNMQEQGMSSDMVRQQLLGEYLISPERTDLLLEIADVQKQVVPDLYELDREVSIYIGIPFCPTHCAYCTFPAYSMTEKATYVDDFLQAMDLEFAHLGRLLREYEIPVTSVYVGGGTPTSLRAMEMERMFDTMFRELPNPDHWRELTVEAGRPDTITPDRVAVMRKYGVNRISVNPQTFKAATLRHIGRGHSPDIVDHRFHYVRDAGFENINMDMILGLPGETLDDVRYTMERIEQLDPESVTIHTMSLKRSAVVKKERDRFDIPHSQVVRAMMGEAAGWARKLGYHPYYVYRQKDILGNMENVGYAKHGKDSIYNICIMEERQTIVGIGGGAVSKLIGANGRHMGRFANPREPKAFVETIDTVVAKKGERLRAVFDSIREARDRVSGVTQR